ncbi:MAG: 50S ribosomal protein L15 [Patescibacteria group bacterium]
MATTLHTLKPNKGSRKRSVRIGRGNASGHGAYSGRGIKGQRARSGGRKNLARRGLKQMLMQLPKNRGFRSMHAAAAVVNLSLLQSTFPAHTHVTPVLLLRRKLITSTKYVKILGDGTLKNALDVHAHAFSATAKTAIEKAGGTVHIMVVPKQPTPRRQAERLAKAAAAA